MKTETAMNPSINKSQKIRASQSRTSVAAEIKNITQTPSLLHWAWLKHISNTICFARILTLIYVHYCAFDFIHPIHA